MPDTTTTDDWPTTVAKFRTLFAPLPTLPPDMNLRGVNYITPDVLGRVVADGEPVEIATGWFMDHRVFGITYNRTADGAPDPRDTSAATLEAVAELLGFAAPTA